MSQRPCGPRHAAKTESELPVSLGGRFVGGYFSEARLVRSIDPVTGPP